MNFSKISTHVEKLIHAASKEGIRRFAVGAGIFHQGKLFICQRLDSDFLGGLWELAGGGVDDGEDVVEALIREVREETALEIDQIRSVHMGFDYGSETGDKTRQFNFNVTVKKTEPVVLTEHQAYRWVTADEAAKLALTPEMRKSVSELFKINL